MGSLPARSGGDDEEESAYKCGVLATTEVADGEEVTLSADDLRSTEKEGAAAGVIVQCTTRDNIVENASFYTPFAHGKKCSKRHGEEWYSALLRAVIKLQALIRSHLARSKTFPSINDRFVEYFDDEHQTPFYVCTETNTSQWNRPRGFGLERGREVLPPLVGGGGSSCILKGEEAIAEGARK